MAVETTPQAEQIMGEKSFTLRFFDGLTIDPGVQINEPNRPIFLSREIDGANTPAGMLLINQSHVILVALSPSESHAMLLDISSEGYVRAFFPTAADFTRWLAEDVLNHYDKATSIPTILSQGLSYYRDGAYMTHAVSALMSTYSIDEIPAHRTRYVGNTDAVVGIIEEVDRLVQEAIPAAEETTRGIKNKSMVRNLHTISQLIEAIPQFGMPYSHEDPFLEQRIRSFGKRDATPRREIIVLHNRPFEGKDHWLNTGPQYTARRTPTRLPLPEKKLDEEIESELGRLLHVAAKDIVLDMDHLDVIDMDRNTLRVKPSQEYVDMIQKLPILDRIELPELREIHVAQKRKGILEIKLAMGNGIPVDMTFQLLPDNALIFLKTNGQRFTLGSKVHEEFQRMLIALRIKKLSLDENRKVTMPKRLFRMIQDSLHYTDNTLL